MDHGGGAGDDTPATEDGAIGAAIGDEYTRAPSVEHGMTVADTGGSAAPRTEIPQQRIGIATGPIDRRSLLAACVGGIGYFLLASISLLIDRSGEAASPIWLPNACAVVFLLRARLSNEWPFLLAAFAASLSSNVVSQQPDHIAALFTIANLAEIAVVAALARPASRAIPDMNRLPDLARFLWAGALAGPLVSTALAVPVLGSSLAEIQRGAIGWFMTDCMAMVLIVPTALLLADRLSHPQPTAPERRLEAAALLLGGTACTFIVFNQTIYPLLFLIPPIAMMHAFRLGSLGSTLHVAVVAVVAAVMTGAGLGPIAISAGSPTTHLHLLQAFIAANFLSGLPVAAILAGRDRIMAELEVGKREIDLLADNITDAILRYDLEGVCTYASPSVRQVMGMEPESLVGQPLGGRIHPEARDRITQAMGRLLTGQSDKERVTYRRFLDRADGMPAFLEADAAIYRHPVTGAREGVLVSARDVTERVELELLLTRARRHAEQAAQAKSDFLANMSHEIRTPMNGVLGFAELMLQGDLPADQRRYAETIVQSGRSMMMLLNDVLDLSKIESGQFGIDLAPIDLHASLAECVTLHLAAAESKGLTLRFNADGSHDSDDEVWITTDGLRLRQIMLNLIGNAVKFTETGRIDVSYRLTDQEVLIDVVDSGIGIAADRQEDIFQPFTQGGGEAGSRFGGTGLGLSISRQLAALLGGRITVDSKPGKGSRFTLTLPAARASQPARAELPEAFADPANWPADARILLVEDHDINRLLVTEMLERCGQEVEVAHDGTEGIAMVIDAIMRGRPYDLVLMDVQMPGCDGYEATRAIRAEGIGPGLLPIIALTANAFPEDVAAARAAGMQAHLAKPVVLADLARALQRWLPTRIIEAAPERRPARRSAMALSPGLVARWRLRREETLAALRKAVAEGWLDDPAPAAADRQREPLAQQVHKLAGSAAMFGEADLGEAAAALDRALSQADPAANRLSIARRVLALGEADPAGAEPSGGPRRARG